MADNAKTDKKKRSVVNRLAAVQVAVMLVLTIAMCGLVTTKTGRLITENSRATAKEKSCQISQYISNVETILSNYSCADEILNAVTEPGNAEYIKAAQKYTEKVSSNIRNLEGIYVSEWDTNVLAHTNIMYTGKPTRSGEALDQLHDLLINSPGNLYNAGIITSPVSGTQIISMYKAVLNSIGQPVGLVGLAVATNDIVADLEREETKLCEDSSYSMIDYESGRYIFSSDITKINTEVSNTDIRKICDSLKDGKAGAEGNFYFVENKKDYYCSYNTIENKNWVFMIDGFRPQLFSMTTNMAVFLIIFAGLYIIIAIVFNRLGKKQEQTLSELQTSLKKSAKTKESLNTAVFNDILTDCRNRVSFTNDFESGNIQDNPDYPYYFIMFNISQFSSVNIMYGEDIGDELLASTANSIRTVLEGAQVYRTGSDEFVAVMQSQNNVAGKSRITGYADQAVMELMKPVKTSAGPVMAVFKASIVKKSKNIDFSVLPALKDIMNQSNVNGPGKIPYLDMDNL